MCVSCEEQFGENTGFWSVMSQERQGYCLRGAWGQGVVHVIITLVQSLMKIKKSSLAVLSIPRLIYFLF